MDIGLGGVSTNAARSLYASSNVDATVTGANTRLSMLSADSRTGNAFITLPAGSMPPGARVLLTGIGAIGARLTTPPGFNLVPWVTPAGGSKTDLPGFQQAPLLGTDGYCEIWLEFAQVGGSIRTAGITRYYAATSGGAMPYSIPTNPGGTGSSGALPTLVASDPNVDRTIGVDGFWGSGADGREYVRCRQIAAVLLPA